MVRTTWLASSVLREYAHAIIDDRNAYIAALRFPRLSQEIGRSVGVCISPVVWLNRCCGFCAGRWKPRRIARNLHKRKRRLRHVRSEVLYRWYADISWDPISLRVTASR